MANQMITFKLNRFTSILQLPTQTQTQTQSPSPSPSDLLTIILFYLNQWLAAISNLFSSLFGPEARAHWPDFAAHWFLSLVGGALLICILCCCLPPILRCITWVLVGIFNLIKGFFMMLFNGIRSVFRCLCCCGRRSVKMMKAPGRGGRVFIPRGGFENNPAAYFQGLRASNSVNLY